MTAERIALNILLKVTEDGAFANLALKEAFSDGRTNDKARVTALVYTAIEHLGFCDRLISAYAKGRVRPQIKGILRLALAEMFFMGAPDYAVCSRAVSLTAEIGKPALKGFVNGVLRSIARDRAADKLPPLPDDFAERLEILSGCPAFMVREYAALYGESFAEELALARVSGTSFRPVYPHTAEEVFEHLSALGLEPKRSALVPDSIVAESINGDITEDELFKSGAMTVQSESAMLACRVLDPKPGMSILDACAAPGGKTAYICDLTGRDSLMTAWDVHPHRVKLIESTLSRLGISGVNAQVKDASEHDESLESSFDAVLLDVPCSGLGGGGKPDARLRRTDGGIEELSLLQLKILKACAPYLKPGCSLVYSTCTVSRRENEGVIERFLNDAVGFEIEPFGALLPESLRERGETGMLQLFPNADGTEGFFIAKLKRT
jgi:16S rRNA (cytosine967-C5)-methyltransferase